VVTLLDRFILPPTQGKQQHSRAKTITFFRRDVARHTLRVPARKYDALLHTRGAGLPRQTTTAAAKIFLVPTAIKRVVRFGTFESGEGTSVYTICGNRQPPLISKQHAISC